MVLAHDVILNIKNNKDAWIGTTKTTMQDVLNFFKWVVHPIFIYPHVILNLYDLLSSVDHNISFSEEQHWTPLAFFKTSRKKVDIFASLNENILQG